MNKRDRGTKKWTSLMLPEHVAMLREFANVDYYRQVKPTLDEYEIAEIESKLQFAYELQVPVVLTAWRDGFAEQVPGVVKRLDAVNRAIVLADGTKVRFGDVTAVRYDD